MVVDLASSFSSLSPQGYGACAVPMALTCFTQLEVWRIAHALTLDVYRRTESFPRREHFGLAAKMRSAASSIGANIGEGFGRRSLRDKARFCDVAEGSAAELRNFLLLARDLGYLPDIGAHSASLDAVGRMLNRLVE
jgi:four helix bundle protein